MWKKENNMYDCVIIGGGPAGLTAGIYLARANKKILILEKENIGGQIASSPLVQNYPGFVSITGSELANNLYEQVESLQIPIELEEVLKINDGKIKQVITEYNTYECKSAIIATGAKYRLLGLENEKELIGSGIHFCVSCDGAFYKNQDVAVIGGGNTAVTNAIYLANLCHNVYLICRKDKLKSEDKLIRDIEDISNIEIIYNSVIEKINGNKELESIDIIQNGNQKRNLEIKALFVSIGLDAQSSIAENILQLNSHNYIISKECKTDVPGIFVAGDVRDKMVRQLTTAVNDGAVAANQVIKYLEENAI